MSAQAASPAMDESVAPASSAADRLLYRCGLALIGAVIAAGLVEPLLVLWRFVPLDPNEGWNALFGDLAMHGGDLYPAPGSLIVNNYPPLSFFIVGFVGRLAGDNIFGGRIVALVSMGMVAVNLYLWLRAAGSAPRIAWLGASLFAALAVTYGRPYAGINDPQWLAHAIMTTGLVVLWRGNANARAIALGALLIMAGGWTKHLLIPLPIATTWWLMRRSKSALALWIGWCALILAAISLAVWWRYGAVFFESLRSAREYSLHQALKETRRAVKCLAPVIALSVLLLPVARRNPRTEFAAVYFLVAALVAVAAAGGSGVDINAFFDLMIAASLGAALAVEAVWRRALPVYPQRVEFGAVLTVLLGLYVGIYAAAQVPGVARDLKGLNALEQQTLAATRLIASQGHGRAACETPELCYWGKNPFVFDFFNYGQRLKVGKEPLTACAQVFDGVSISLVQIDPNKGQGSPQLPAACNAVIERNYRPVLISSLGEILAPARALSGTPN